MDENTGLGFPSYDISQGVTTVCNFFGSHNLFSWPGTGQPSVHPPEQVSCSSHHPYPPASGGHPGHWHDNQRPWCCTCIQREMWSSLKSHFRCMLSSTPVLCLLPLFSSPYILTTSRAVSLPSLWHLSSQQPASWSSPSEGGGIQERGSLLSLCWFLGSLSCSSAPVSPLCGWAMDYQWENV